MTSTIPPDVQDGYRGLAKFIGPHLDEGVGIFKRFANLNALNILYMQAELIDVEQDLQAWASIDESSGDKARQAFARSVAKMKNAPNSPQWSTILETRKLLNEYNAALQQQAEFTQLQKAREYDRSVVQAWILNKEGGNSFLKGSEAQLWLPGNLHDLVSVSSRTTNDAFTRFTEEKVLPWAHWLALRRWKKPIAGQEKTRMVKFEASKFVKTTRILAVCLSTVLPSLAVLGLYFIDHLTARMGAIIAFSGVFSFVLAVFTNAKPIEIFTATASFATVQVVFVGGTDVGSNGKYIVVANETLITTLTPGSKVAVDFHA